MASRIIINHLSFKRTRFLQLNPFVRLGSAMAHINTPAPGAREYYPLNEPAIGTRTDGVQPELFKPLTIKDVTFKNRIFVSPMCQYSSSDGHATDWHLVHIGGYATRGVGAVCVEATSVVPEGRISPEDARIVEFCHAQGTKVGIQLAHAGRKASTYAPWVKDRVGHGASWIAGGERKRLAQQWFVQFSLKQEEWFHVLQFMAPARIPFSETYPNPKEMTEQDMQYVEDAFVAATKRSREIGCTRLVAHKFTVRTATSSHEFVSPLSNTRTDQYGGSLENRLRFPTRLLQRIREAWSDKPLFVRISATDWAEGPEKAEDGTWLQWGIEQSNLWVDKISGGNWVKQKISPIGALEMGHGYQVPFAENIKKAHPSLLVGAADVVFLARELMRNPHWALTAAKTLGVKVKAANQYERAW
ncbi:hypothetical protein C8F04DRAFT_1083511 [Mycena alexandri]|uniref:NADH:flavin oxidoreductase/NADH oxidase N-terminal domain-containing protein n=1 Tax=Mycena alexandri TaxID=1745969 RepID=A0AAD6X649_9AGAR|nr:hypothetical protein C8F04DRAFT_1083511 [Mycena alexandri]